MEHKARSHQVVERVDERALACARQMHAPLRQTRCYVRVAASRMRVEGWRHCCVSMWSAYVRRPACVGWPHKEWDRGLLAGPGDDDPPQGERQPSLRHRALVLGEDVGDGAVVRTTVRRVRAGRVSRLAQQVPLRPGGACIGSRSSVYGYGDAPTSRAALRVLYCALSTCWSDLRSIIALSCAPFQTQASVMSVLSLPWTLPVNLFISGVPCIWM